LKFPTTGDIQNTLSICENSSQLFERIDEFNRQAEILGEIAEIHYKMRDSKNAALRINEAMRIYQKLHQDPDETTRKVYAEIHQKPT
jgi:adenylate cyclase class IV